MEREAVLNNSLVELSLLTNSNKDIETILEIARMTCMGNFMPALIEIFFREGLDYRNANADSAVRSFTAEDEPVRTIRERKQPFEIQSAPGLAGTAAFQDVELVVPVWFKESLLGFFLLGKKSDETPFEPADRAHLEKMASITGTALQNAILINNLEEEVSVRTRQLEEARSVAETERAKSDRLLLNILPEEIAEEIKTSGVPRPQHFDSVTVLFTDFKGFTAVAEQMQPHELVTELDRCFSYFDNVVERFNLEKLKTIGDAYMCAGGIPIANGTHAVEAVLAAIEIINFMEQVKDIRSEQNLPYWELRLGINTGPLVAGVIGEKKFAYDVWGDTVNTASRMESAGMPGKINISKSTRDIVEPFFDLEDRGKIPAKNKGEIDMYLVTGIKANLKDGESNAPNEAFFKMLSEIAN